MNCMYAFRHSTLYVWMDIYALMYVCMHVQYIYYTHQP